MNTRELRIQKLAEIDKNAGEALTQTGPYMWKADSGKPGKQWTVNACVHGNEVIGALVLERLIAAVKQGALKAGSLNLNLANPKAFIEGVRGVDADLNRCMGQQGGGYEYQRAAEIAPSMQGVDGLTCLHSTILPSKPMVIATDVSREALEIIASLGVSSILTGPALLSPEGEAIDTDTYVAKFGGLGITFEAGWMEELDVDGISAAVFQQLVNLGIFDCKVAGDLSDFSLVNRVTDFKVTKAYKKFRMGKKFKWSKPWKNGEKVDKGKVLAINDDEKVVADRDSIIMFPKQGEYVKPGVIACILSEMPESLQL